MYPGNKRKKLWREEKERLLKMTLEERRQEYLRDYVALKNIPTWMEDLKSKSESDGENTKEDLQGKRSLSEKVSLYRGDITLLEVDAIVNAGKEESKQACIEFDAEDGKASLLSKERSSCELESLEL